MSGEEKQRTREERRMENLCVDPGKKTSVALWEVGLKQKWIKWNCTATPW